MLIFGIDLITGSVRSRTVQPKYALVITKDGKIVRELAVSQHRLVRLVHREQPGILAVDSVQELAPHTQDLYRFLELLPSKTMFVVVTGGDRQIGLIQVAARYNISFDRFDPFAEARAIAQVAYHGAGVQVLAFEKETEITVTRNRSPGKGGWSQNRYARKIHGNVLRYARDIEQELQGRGLPYWKKEYKAFGGVSRVTFHVREIRDQIPVTSSRGGDVQIRLSGKRLERIQYRPVSARPKYLIVGIDPGTTIGVDALAGLLDPAEPVASHGGAGTPAGASLDAISRDAMQRALAANGGNVSAAARQLGVNRSTLYRRLGMKPTAR